MLASVQYPQYKHLNVAYLRVDAYHLSIIADSKRYSLADEDQSEREEERLSDIFRSYRMVILLLRLTGYNPI